MKSLQEKVNLIIAACQMVPDYYTTRFHEDFMIIARASVSAAYMRIILQQCEANNLFFCINGSIDGKGIEIWFSEFTTKPKAVKAS